MAILVGNNVDNAAISSVVTVLAVEALPAGAGVAVVTAVASVVVLVFGENVSKSARASHAESQSRQVARPVRLVELVLTPLVVVFDVVTHQLTAVLGGEARIEQPDDRADQYPIDRPVRSSTASAHTRGSDRSSKSVNRSGR